MSGGFPRAEEIEQRFTNGGLPGQMAHFAASQIRHIENVDRLFAKGHDMGGGDVEVELANRGR